MFVYIRNGEIIMTSDAVMTKLQPEVLGERLAEDGETIESYVEIPFVDGLAYDEVIETKLPSPVALVDGKIVKAQEEVAIFPETPAKDRVRDVLMVKKIDEITPEDLEGVAYTDFEVGELIIRRFFGSNPHAQTARLAEIGLLQMKVSTKTATEADMARISEIADMYGEIQKFKNIFYV